MAEFVPPQFQNPDFLRSAALGQQMGIQAQLAPGELQGQQQGLQQGQLTIDQMRLALQSQKTLQDFATRSLQGGAQNAGAPTGGIQNGPQGAAQSGDGYAPEDYAGSIPGIAPSPLSAGTMNAIGILGGDKLLKGIQDTQKLQQEQRDSQMKVAQLRAAGPLMNFDALADSPSPTRMAMSNPSIISQWPKIAQHMGFDPVKDFDDKHIALAAIYGGNQLRAQVGLSPRAMPVQLQTSSNNLGGVYQTDPLTGKETQVKGDEPLQKVIDPKTGQPTLVPASKAVGMQPFNESIFGAGNISDNAKDMAYQFAKVNGGQLPPNMNFRGNSEKAAMANYIADRMKGEGLTAQAMVAQGQATKAAQGVVKDFESGTQSKAINGINTAVQHMASLDPLIDAMGNGDTKLINKIGNSFREQTGSAAPTNYAALKEFVGGEVAKAVLPGGGGEAERQALTAPLNAANSPEQLKQAVQTIKTALAGKTEALRNQWDVGTNGTQGSFDKFLLPATKNALGISSQSSTASAGTPVKVSSPEEAAKLAPGTVFITPDGRTKVR